eukprot:12614103-Alexandrium_andersonii.AAC.1
MHECKNARTHSIARSLAHPLMNTTWRACCSHPRRLRNSCNQEGSACKLARVLVAFGNCSQQPSCPCASS